MNAPTLLEYEVPSRKQPSVTFWILVAGVMLAMLLALVPIKWGGGNRADARRAAVQAELHTLNAAVEQFAGDVGRYPTTAEGLNALVSTPAGVEHWHGLYLSKSPKDPWGSPYVYRQVVRDGKPEFELRTFAGGATERSAADLAGGK